MLNAIVCVVGLTWSPVVQVARSRVGSLGPGRSSPRCCAPPAIDPELSSYWKAHSASWEAPLRKLDVRAAWGCGELDGILPSGAASRVETQERFLTLGRALELFESDQLQVRRRFRGSSETEMATRWNRVMGDRAALQASGRWEIIVKESDAARKFGKARLEGGVEDADASPALSRVVVTLLSPALKAAAKQRARADSGFELSLAELMDTAGANPAERWVTAKLLAEIEEEIGALPVAKPAPPSSSFAAGEAQRDVEQATNMGFYGIGAALLVVFLQALLFGGGGLGGGFGGAQQSSLEATLELLNHK